MSEFSKVLISDDRMILCKDEDFDNLDEFHRQLLIKSAFPDSVKTIWYRLFKNVLYTVEHRYKMFSGRFYPQIKKLEICNNWDSYPFVSLLIHKKENSYYCRITKISINN